MDSPAALATSSPSPAPAAPARNTLHTVLWALVLPIPFVIALTGAWVGTTLAVNAGHGPWLALLGAFVVFGVIPLVWELLADRHQVGGRLRDAILRSSALSLLLLAVLVVTNASSTYQALATRGDWFLAGSMTPAAESIRGFMFKAAEGFRWVDATVRGDDYRWADTTEKLGDALAPGASARVPPRAAKALADHGIAGTNHRWPLPPGPHRLATALPAEHATSPNAIGAWIASQTDDPVERVAAIHDIIILRTTYDHARIADGSYELAEPQSATMVFEKKLGVCAGYANLFEAIAKAAGLEAVVISGQSRGVADFGHQGLDSAEEATTRPLDDIGHVWNAVRIGDDWHIVDATWNDDGPEKPPQRDYLLIPAHLAISTHLPDEETWQLLEKPLSPGEWLRQPLMRPEGHRFGIRLVDLQRPVAPTPKPFRIAIDNPRGHKIGISVEAGWRPSTAAERARDPDAEDGKRVRCGKSTTDRKAVFECQPPAGPFKLSVFGWPEGSRTGRLLAHVLMTPD
jgi:hypothetical protein